MILSNICNGLIGGKERAKVVLQGKIAASNADLGGLSSITSNVETLNNALIFQLILRKTLDNRDYVNNLIISAAEFSSIMVSSSGSFG